MDIADSIVVEPASRDPETLRSLAILRMTVFRNWPYLYDGNMSYEMDYLTEFLGDPGANLIVARISDIAVGMATASRLSCQASDVSGPLVAAGFGLAETFYFGESVLLPQFRGRGIGHAFFDHREAAARAAGATAAAFCAVVRPDDHPARPSDARDLAPFWGSRGYSPVDGALTIIDWKDRDAPASTPHPMQYWARRL
jgi:GNAT superfamily N-acetyltransferase